MTVDGKGEVDGASAGDCGMVDDVLKLGRRVGGREAQGCWMVA